MDFWRHNLAVTCCFKPLFSQKYSHTRMNSMTYLAFCPSWTMNAHYYRVLSVRMWLKRGGDSKILRKKIISGHWNTVNETALQCIVCIYEIYVHNFIWTKWSSLLLSFAFIGCFFLFLSQSHMFIQTLIYTMSRILKRKVVGNTAQLNRAIYVCVCFASAVKYAL